MTNERHHEGSSCAVCAHSDRRALVDVAHDDGSIVVLCGTHAVMMRRLSRGTPSVAALRALVRERRGRAERRLGEDEGDALAMALHAGFAGERRQGHDRRA